MVVCFPVVKEESYLVHWLEHCTINANVAGSSPAVSHSLRLFPGETGKMLKLPLIENPNLNLK